MDQNTEITVAEAYVAMRTFVESFWERGGSAHDSDLSDLLSFGQYGEAGPTKTADPAQWSDWLDAVKKAKQ